MSGDHRETDGYLYPALNFTSIELPESAQRAAIFAPIELPESAKRALVAGGG